MAGTRRSASRGSGPRPAVSTLSLPGFLAATYRVSLKSSRSDEWINTYAIRPAASVLVWIFHRLGLRPVQVVLLGTAAGTAAGLALVLDPGGHGLWIGGWLLLAKVVLDAADGQLARATGQVDRIGRFADSISDFWVNGWIALGAAVAAVHSGAVVEAAHSGVIVSAAHSGATMAADSGMTANGIGLVPALLLGAAVFLLLVLQCSFFVFYQVSFLRRGSKSPANRTDERPVEDELRAPPLERRLQSIYLMLYGWQDRAIARLDSALLERALRRCARRPSCLHALSGPDAAVFRNALEEAWYSDAPGLRLSSFLGLGTSNVVYGVCLLAGSARGALLWIAAGESCVALVSILYRWFWLPRGVPSPKTASSNPSMLR